MLSFEGIRLKIVKLRRDLFAKSRAKKLNNKEFTIISNNCWGGTVYESYDLIKQSPTVGCFFMAEDYIRFLKRLDEYLAAELTFIDHGQSKYYERFKSRKNFGTYPIGRLCVGGESVEIFFLHHKSEASAKEKWIRRTKRINLKKLIVKFNDQNCCREQDVAAFAALPFKNKVLFTVRKDWAEKYNGIYIRQPFKKEHVLTSYEPFGKSRYIDLTEYINSL